ncbi:MAG TPA: hypothetical protein VFW06_05435 [Acidimicrobiia bacterium]|nr:hypothetical protein [Acidimicrobiia bacterium]
MQSSALRSAAVAAAIAVGLLVPTGRVGASAPTATRTQTTPAKGVNPCAVLDSDVIGDTVGGDASPSTRAGRHICRWFVDGAVADEDERTVVLVSVERYRGRAKQDIAENSAEPSAVEVAGLTGADIAFYDLRVVPPTITVVQGGRLFVVQMNALDTKRATVDALEALAAEVLDNL